MQVPEASLPPANKNLHNVMQHLYWTIDLDFWQGRNNKFKFNTEILDSLRHKHIPIHVVLEHHHTLKHLKGLKFNTLINSDFHSDIADLETNGSLPVLNEGTWVNRISGRAKKTYIWHYPMQKCLTYSTGYCHREPRNPFDFNKRGVCDWALTFKRQEFFPRDCDGELIGACICLSPAWTGLTTIGTFCQWYKKYKKSLIVDSDVKQFLSARNLLHSYGE